MAVAEEVRHGRNYIRRGDTLRYQERPGCRWQDVRFLYADEDSGGLFYAVVGDRGHRFLRPDRIKRVPTTRRPRR